MHGVVLCCCVVLYVCAGETSREWACFYAVQPTLAVGSEGEEGVE